MAYTHGIKWTNKKVQEEIHKVMRSLNVERMPTRNEIINVTKSNALPCAISRGKGYYGWAKELGLQVKNSETTFGKQSEYDVKSILEKLNYKVEKMPQNYPFDLLVNENIKIDVKSSRLYKGPQGSFYTFNLEKKYASCDIYIILCLKENDDIDKLLIIPSNKLKITQLSVGKESKYDIYKNNYKTIQEYDEFYKKLSVE